MNNNNNNSNNNNNTNDDDNNKTLIPLLIVKLRNTKNHCFHGTKALVIMKTRKERTSSLEFSLMRPYIQVTVSFQAPR